MLKFPPILDIRQERADRPQPRRKKILRIWDLPSIQRDEPPAHLKAILAYLEAQEVESPNLSGSSPSCQVY